MEKANRNGVVYGEVLQPNYESACGKGRGSRDGERDGMLASTRELEGR